MVRLERTVEAADGVELAVTTYAPEGRPPEEVALLLSATGARQERYEPFARHLAQEGWQVVTFDYRGIGRSARQEAQRRTASMRAWGEQDLTGLISWARGALGARRLVAVGHSIGGQLLPFAANHRLLDAVAVISSQRGYWRLWRGWERYGVWSFFKLYIPLCLRLFGRVPMSFAGLEDLEREVAQDYARWGLSEAYLWPDGEPRDARFAECTFPLLALSFEDDTHYAPRRAVEVLLRDYYTSAPALWCHVEHGRLGLAGLGHSGFFEAERCPRGWWSDVSAWLRQASASSLPLPRREARDGGPALASIATPILRAPASSQAQGRVLEATSLPRAG
jgi:predicted alpha/beta hydrolase